MKDPWEAVESPPTYPITKLIDPNEVAVALLKEIKEIPRESLLMALKNKPTFKYKSKGE